VRVGDRDTCAAVGELESYAFVDAAGAACYEGGAVEEGEAGGEGGEVGVTEPIVRRRRDQI
jgi:hypothetical protein